MNEKVSGKISSSIHIGIKVIFVELLNSFIIKITAAVKNKMLMVSEIKLIMIDTTFLFNFLKNWEVISMFMCLFLYVARDAPRNPTHKTR